MKWLSNLWNVPGNAWKAALAAAPITVWMRFGASLIAAALTTGLVLIIWRGPWTLAVEARRVDWLGYALMAGMFTIVICVVALFDFRLNLQASRDGLKADMAGDTAKPEEE